MKKLIAVILCIFVGGIYGQGKEEGTKLSREIFVSVYKNHEFVCGGIFVSDKHILILSLCTFGTPSSIFLIKSHTVEPISIEKIVYQDEIGSSIGLIILTNGVDLIPIDLPNNYNQETIYKVRIVRWKQEAQNQIIINYAENKTDIDESIFVKIPGNALPSDITNLKRRTFGGFLIKGRVLIGVGEDTLSLGEDVVLRYIKVDPFLGFILAHINSRKNIFERFFICKGKQIEKRVQWYYSKYCPSEAMNFSHLSGNLWIPSQKNSAGFAAKNESSQFLIPCSDVNRIPHGEKWSVKLRVSKFRSCLSNICSQKLSAHYV